MLGNRHHVAYVDVPGAGDDLDGLVGIAHADLAHPHMVRVGVALHGQNLAHHYVGDLGAQVGGDLHLGAGQSHSFRKFFIIGLNSDKLVEPVTT